MLLLSPDVSVAQSRAMTKTERWARNFVMKLLDRLDDGSLLLKEGHEEFVFGRGNGPHGAIEVLDPGFYKALLLGGSNGAAESYMDGYWRSPNLANVIRVMACNMATSDALESGMARVVAPLLKLGYYLQRNTKEGSRKNIEAHYDLSNDFFSCFLDPTMMYSSGVFLNKTDSMEAASREKLDRICRKLHLHPGDRVVEIGTGWGGFAIHAAKHYGCHVTTTTISKEQHAFAAAAIKREGLEGRITLLMKDYRDLKGQFDKLVSIEMIEAVGHQFLNTYFEKCASLLKPDGQMVIQAITMPDNRYASALREVDFIKKYIFPGSFIPSVGAMMNAVSRTDLRLVHLEDQAEHYAETLRRWRQAFYNKQSEQAITSRSNRFLRMWEYYFCYCEGGFEERVIGCAQLHFTKPKLRQASLLQRFGNER